MANEQSTVKAKSSTVEYDPKNHVIKMKFDVEMSEKYTWRKGDLIPVSRDGYKKMAEKYPGKFEIVTKKGLPVEG